MFNYMTRVNYHTHTTVSDGEMKPEELIKLAIKKRFNVLGITDHYHFPPGFRNWGNEFYSDKHYETLKRLKEKYRAQIRIFVNVEFDWLEDYADWIKKEATNRNYDYRFISVHFLKMGKEYVPIDYSEEEFQKMAKGAGGIKELVKLYYSNLRDAIKSGCFDVVAHMDLIKIWNSNEKYFSEKEAWYRREIEKTLEQIKSEDMKLDLNTAGLRKPCAEIYPSEWIVNDAKKLGIQFLIGTDAHKADELESGLTSS